ncbi:MAG: D-amino acid aminotransferase, partial [Gammaproteobacteria bacterium]|nr:D-amino acid aminotransferase [Gammaproteobacteria bacterium]
MSAIVYLNGEFLPADEAKVSVLDRGFIFGDGIYEVIPVYGGRLFRLEHHLNRLDHSLQGIHLENPLPHSQWRSVFEQLVEKNGGSDHSLYLQITRGVAQRDHAIPLQNEPTLFAMCNPLKSPNLSTYRQGIEAITIEDIRWKHCNIKAIALLPNILLRQQAINAGVSDAIMLRDGEVTEGTAANAFIVKNGCVITPPKSNLLLPGITRDLVVELCQEHKIPVEERAILEEELTEADEVWLTSSTKEILPVTRLNGKPVAK